MMKNKKLAIIVFTFLLVNLLIVPGVFSQEFESNNPEVEIDVHYFWMEGCPACARQEEFNENLTEKYPEVNLHKYRMYPPEEGAQEAWNEFKEKHDIESLVTPTTIVDGEVFEGYSSTIAQRIENVILENLGEETEDVENVIRVPIIGTEISIGALSLPVITILLGTFDGFNVCSIGALILVISIVIKFESRKKILLYGGIFLFTTAFAYGLLAFFWRGVMSLFEKYIGPISIFIGAAAIGGGIYFFKDFIKFYKYGPTCETTSTEFVNNIQNRVQNVLLDEKKGALAAISVIIIFAVAITIVELPCSVGLPLTFTGILTDAGVGTMSFAYYVILYMFMYLLIELVIFAGAVYTKDIWYGPDRAVTWITLIASLVLLGIGVYYIYPYIPLIISYIPI